MPKLLTKRQLQRKSTLLKHKLIRKSKRLIKKEAVLRYKEWAKAIKERDGYTCQVCNTNHKDSDPRAIQAAHILSKENYPELKLDMMNGITLCFSCHKNGRISSHLDGFAFSYFFKNKFPERYEYLIGKLQLKSVNRISL